MDIISQTQIAIEFVKNKKYKQAEKIYLELLEINPENPIVLSLIGYLYLTTKQMKKSEKFFEKAFSISKSVSSFAGLALSKFLQEKFEEAIPLYVELVKIEPKYEYYQKLTMMLASYISLNGTKKYGEMGYFYTKKAIELFPLKKDLLLNFSIICIYTGRLKDGEKYCNIVLKMDSNYPEALSHMGFIQEFLYCDEEKAQECYKKALKYTDNKCPFYYNLGISYSKSSKYILANRYFQKALKLSSDNKHIIRAISANYFKQRKFKEGYKYFINQYDNKELYKFKKIWDGKKHKDKVLFIYPDMAYGDHIQFSRYLPFLKDKFKKVKFFVYPDLKELFENNFDGIEFIEKIPRYDYFVSLMNLPYYLKLDFNNIPFSCGYLDAPTANIKSDKLKIGICWEAGNADIRSSIHRTININEFAKLFKQQEYDFYSFQVNPSTDDYLKYNLKNLGKDFNNFNDTASALKAMDLLISVDTSVANLAGALGIKTFMLLPYYADWRWFDNTQTTEWYDSVRIFKQTQKNNWENEINRIILELTKLKQE